MSATERVEELVGLDDQANLEDDPEALTLFGYPPRKTCVCPACGIRAEPYRGKFCFRCEVTGDADRKLAHPTTTTAEREAWGRTEE
jgi:hypothetical protein